MRSLLLLALVATPAFSGTLETSAGPVQMTRIAKGLKEPWSLAFLPDGGFLVTERGGHLWRFDAAGERREITGLPEIVVAGQGGLLDVVVPRDFPQSGEILLSYVAPIGAGSGTALASAQLGDTSLSAVTPIFTLAQGYDTDYHFGGRIVEAPDGTLFLSTGERGQGMDSLDPAAPPGKVYRLTRSGARPDDNPFPGSLVWTMGHRNPQGLALGPDGTLWESEHGAKGGDEINRLTPGGNYGWPLVAYGVNYDNTPIGIGHEGPGVTQPAHYWDPSMAPSGHMVYSGKLWPDWTGDHFLGSLKFDYISRVDPDTAGKGGWAEEVLRAPETGRVRDIREAPDGSIWFLSVDRGAVFRMAP